MASADFVVDLSTARCVRAGAGVKLLDDGQLGLRAEVDLPRELYNRAVLGDEIASRRWEHQWYQLVHVLLTLLRRGS